MSFSALGNLPPEIPCTESMARWASAMSESVLAVGSTSPCALALPLVSSGLGLLVGFFGGGVGGFDGGVVVEHVSLPKHSRVVLPRQLRLAPDQVE